MAPSATKTEDRMGQELTWELWVWVWVWDAWGCGCGCVGCGWVCVGCVGECGCVRGVWVWGGVRVWVWVWAYVGVGVWVGCGGCGCMWGVWSVGGGGVYGGRERWQLSKSRDSSGVQRRKQFCLQEFGAHGAAGLMVNLESSCSTCWTRRKEFQARQQHEQRTADIKENRGPGEAGRPGSDGCVRT